MIRQFLRKHNGLPEQINGEDSLRLAMEEMDRGLAGEGKLPMIPSYLTVGIPVEPGASCAVLDAGGTNLRTALAVFGEDGCSIQQLRRGRMPGTQRTMEYEEFYQELAAPLRQLGAVEKVGFCFSYNVTLDRTLDGCLDFWCKEVQVPGAVGKPVGASLKKALGSGCGSVHVLNDSVAAMLGAGDVQVGIILGTGVNVCYLEQCARIPKLPAGVNADTMIISTEIGEFDGIPASTFERQVMEASDAPDSAWGEKQCSGGYLGDVICAAWREAAREGILPESYLNIRCSLASISRLLAGEAVPEIPESHQAVQMAHIMVERAAKIAAVLCAGPIIRAGQPGQCVRMAVEGSQFWKLTGFRAHFCRELEALLLPYQIRYQVVQRENACLIGAALAAFAQPM